jgi:hypothetical protein
VPVHMISDTSFRHCEERDSSLMLWNKLRNLAWSFPFVVARHGSAEAISVGLRDCRASLAMTKKGARDDIEVIIQRYRHMKYHPFI